MIRQKNTEKKVRENYIEKISCHCFPQKEVVGMAGTRIKKKNALHDTQLNIDFPGLKVI